MNYKLYVPENYLVSCKELYLYNKSEKLDLVIKNLSLKEDASWSAELNLQRNKKENNSKIELDKQAKSKHVTISYMDFKVECLTHNDILNVIEKICNYQIYK